MTTVHLAHPWTFCLLGLMIPAGALMRYAALSRERALRLWGLSQSGFDWLPVAGLALSYVLLVAAIARPYADRPTPKVDSHTTDVAFLIDVSRSMLTTDAQPSRLELAKASLATTAAQFKGERVSLVAFAGNAAMLCPLTVDYAYFRNQLARVGPGAVTRGGTRFAEAIHFALTAVFDNLAGRGKTLVLVTDGGDQDSDLTGALLEAKIHQIRILFLGVGDETRASIVPRSEFDSRPWLYRGKPVATRLEADRLHSLAAQTGDGRYLPLGTTPSNPAVLYHALGAGQPVAESDRVEIAPVLLIFAALLLIALERPKMFQQSLSTSVPALLLCGMVGCQVPNTATLPSSDQREVSADDGSVRSLIEEGNRQFEKGLYPEAASRYARASRIAPDAPEVWFNFGAALYRSRLYSEAASAFEHAASAPPNQRAQALFMEANAKFRNAVSLSTHDPYTAQHQLISVISLYREAYRLDSRLQDSRYNVEVTKRRILECERALNVAASASMIGGANDATQRGIRDADQILRLNERQDHLPERLAPPQVVERDW